ncbi:hypothetical protein Tco_0820143 [Tanacetum coccineum]|uniref:Tf2-1-like SH3-like domain-containing protein n=1 Tax=Tanacetum coccineum TaxID=301880 RepID=A0ABQ5ADA7_9ASTR
MITSQLQGKLWLYDEVHSLACVLDFRGSWDVHLPLAEVGEGQLIGPELVQETTEKISQIKDRLKAALSPWKGVVRFGKKGKLAPRFVGPFEIIEKVGPVAYRLDLPEELDGVHDTFHVSNLKKCLADPTLQVPLDEIQVDAKLNFVKEPVEILEKEFKKLKRSRISIVKVRWNSKCGPEFKWEREDQMKLKYPHSLVMLVAEFRGRNSFKGVECNLCPFCVPNIHFYSFDYVTFVSLFIFYTVLTEVVEPERLAQVWWRQYQ